MCATCHAFLYASSLEQEIQLGLSEEQPESDDCDSGNDEPSDYFPLERRPSFSLTPKQETASAGGDEEGAAPPLVPVPALTRRVSPSIQLESLAERLLLLEQPQVVAGAGQAPEGLVCSLPPEVTLNIFIYLDDISLYAVGNVCR